ncbi:MULTISPECIES: hypothetical protein [Streptomyces]|uniref:Uncharacterized protein n=1 Tax=Streptomyces dengpaensis TaxID=2049881 RepID=A0ABM6SYS5_9ACTN|nr:MULTISPECIES: hypothetical protein [Streptomyces]AVH59943.1 hypothetical protein C4B68_33880 [Streptomyces dengpaensis]PIB09578.1 hypothetical protein B1C81_10555 [Streptomyces sp. HG99]
MTACPNPTKSRYATREAAETAARRVALRIEAPLRPYECACTWWHLTKNLPERPVDVSAATRHDIEFLNVLPDIDFREVVVRDADGQGDPGQRAALRHHRNQVRWKKQLGQLIADVEEQLKDRRGDKSLASHDWAKRATGYRDSLIVRLNECKRLRAADHAQAIVNQEHRRRDAEIAAAAGATVKELRAAAGEIAVQRLIAAHGPEFDDYLAEEYAVLGISLPARVERHRRERGAA